MAGRTGVGGSSYGRKAVSDRTSDEKEKGRAAERETIHCHTARETG